MLQCLKCGRFCKNITADVNGLEQITKVEGDCSKCGHVDLTKADWHADDFFYEPE